MCNPRRIRVAATRELDEAWRREVTQVASLSQEVAGEARLRRSLADTVGAPALRALESLLAAGRPGWEETSEGWRCEVEGGYALYRIEDQSLEIVAVRRAVVEASGSATDALSGRVTASIEREAEGVAYDDGWNGRTEKAVRKEVEDALESGFREDARRRVEEDQRRALTESEADRRRRAEAAAARALQETATSRRETLEREATETLQTVGQRARLAFHGVLGLAYRDALLAYARRNGASEIMCREEGGVIEIQCVMP